MATFSGNAGVVQVGSTPIAEVRGFSVEASGDTNDDSVMGDAWRTFKPSFKSWSGSCDVLFDDTDTSGQMACTVGASLTFKFCMEGSGNGQHKLTGTGIVTGRSINSTHDGLVEASLSIQGTGELVEGVMP